MNSENPPDAAPQEDVFLRYFSRDRYRIYRFIYSLLPNEADAEDVFQQASIILWKRFGDFDQDREFYPWACSVAVHAVQNYRRSAKRRRFLLNDELMKTIADEQINSSQRSRYRLELLEECIALLKPKDHELVKRVYLVESSAKTVADQMGKSAQTIYNRLSAIRKKLLLCVNRKSSHA
ncbi:RNA polymerase sigma factor CnrH [Planctomycetes bacterium MalM25]|nr:RNA polymerase sigma factor CnrH [Planctomycetes bacterium MalM25]